MTGRRIGEGISVRPGQRALPVGVQGYFDALLHVRRELGFENVGGRMMRRNSRRPINAQALLP